MMTGNWQKAYFFLSVIVVAFLCGAAAEIFQFFPYKHLAHAADALVDLEHNWRAYTILPQARFLEKNDFGGHGVLLYDKDRAFNGVTLYSGIEKKRLALKLIDMHGNLLHEWTVSFNELWPKAGHLDHQPGDLHQSITGAMLLKNGDVIFDMYRVGMVRMDRCGNVIWKLPIRAHHQFNPSLTGGLWVPCEVSGEKQYGKENGGLDTPSLKLRNPEEICEISAGGRLLRTIDPVEAFFRNGLGPMLLPSGLTEYKSYHFKSNGDTFTHLNDIEVVTEKLASAFPMFKAGDLLLSLCTQNLLAVMDPETEVIKWTMRGPFFNQHDPDLLPNGKIRVFDNLGANLDRAEKDGSRILEIDPATEKVRTVYDSNKDNFFYSETQGNDQTLDNGDLMIVESLRGRIFEVTPKGDIVWSFVSNWNDDKVVIIDEATRYPLDYVDFTKKSCP
jgi:hypothetical protein